MKASTMQVLDGKLAEHGSRVVAAVFVMTLFPALLLGQSALPTKISLWGTGSPEFPTGYWAGDSDPHFRHRSDTLFWLNTEHVATSFFKGFCCSSGNEHGVKYGAAVFDTKGAKIALHDWTAEPDAPFVVRGGAGSFWLMYRTRIDALKDDFTVAEQIPLTEHSVPLWPKKGDGVAVTQGVNVSIYRAGMTALYQSAVLPTGALLVDFNPHVLLVNNSSTKGCYIGVLRVADAQVWTLSSSVASASKRCEKAEALISDEAVLITDYDAGHLEIVHRDGSIEVVSGLGKVIGVADSGRIAIQTFRPSRLARELDLDFGGQKDILVYDPSTKNVMFRKTIDGQAGAALAPDGQHLAVVEGKSLLIYSLP
jgi:hypothetical protein